jgi:geranylgeranyl reductase family protein
MYDVIIIGGGPAGSSAARKASSLGLKTLLLEKENFPRSKPCGGAVSDTALSYLDFELPSTIRLNEMRGIRIIYKGQKLEKNFPTRIGILVNREIFDDHLLKMAKESGAKIVTEERVIEYDEEEHRLRVTTDKRQYESHYLIIAEGAHGELKHKVRKKDRKHEYAISLVTEIDKDGSRINEFTENIIEVYAGTLKRGFGWVFPHRRYYSVGIAGLAKYLDNPKDRMTDFLELLGFSRHSQIKSHLLPSGGINRTLTTSRVVLIGDAAGFVDSFYGEGIPYAIRSGQIAAETISRIMKRERSFTLDDYNSLVRDEFVLNLRYSLQVSKFANSFPLFYDIGIENEAIVDKFIDIALQKVTYKNLMKWLFPRLPKYLLKHFIKKIFN